MISAPATPKVIRMPVSMAPCSASAGDCQGCARWCSCREAFNTLLGHVLAKSRRLDAFIAADDSKAKTRDSTYLESLGLRPLDVGRLHMAQALEVLGLLMIGLARNGAGTWISP